ncbi:MAG: rod shape-determining protein MreC [Vicinamibacterales bacterium]
MDATVVRPLTLRLTMALLDFRLRAGYLFLAVVVGHVVLISAQVNARSGVPILETLTFGAFAEVQRASSSVRNGIVGAWTGYVDLRGVRAENQALRHQLAQLQVQLQEQRALAGRARSLEGILELRKTVDLETTAARIIGAAALPEFRSVTIDKGARDGIQPDMAVIAPTGVVGRVVVVGARASRVQLLVDHNAAAGALLERSRAQGVLVGADEGLMQLEYVPELSDVAAGDVVVTAGIDGIYPNGLTLGIVDRVEKGAGPYRNILVRPSVDFASLEDVLVVLTPPPARQPSSENGK